MKPVYIELALSLEGGTNFMDISYLKFIGSEIKSKKETIVDS